MTETRNERVYSVTSLMAYETCPYQYYVAHVLRIPPPVTPAMRAGSNIHKLIADHLRQPQLLPGEIEPSMLPLLERFRASRFNVTPVAVEYPFSLPMRGGTIRGRIDLVVPGESSRLEVVDFKSGAGRESGEMARSLQLPMYALAASRLLEVADEIDYTYYFLRDGTEVRFTSSPAERERIADRVESILEHIELGVFPAAPGCTCYACRRVKRLNGASVPGKTV